MISILGIYMLVLFILSAFLFTYTIDRNINTHIRIACFVNSIFCAVMLRRMFIINDDISRFILLDKFMLQLIPIVMVVLFIVVRDKRAFTTNSSAIKESFDSMSDGICFASLGGTPLLVNKVMNNFAEMISGEQIMNANVFYDALLSGDYDLSVLRKEPTINIKCGDRVYNFNRKVISVGDEEVYEMTLTDITKQYELNLQLNNDKKRLDNLNLKLKKMSMDIERIVNEEEVLNARSKVHDEVGRCLLLARSYFIHENKESNKVVLFWRYVIDVIKKQGLWLDDFNAIYVESERLGVRLHINGDFNFDDNNKHIIKEVILEALNNGVKHGKCKNLFCDINGKHIELYNDGDNRVTSYVEKGGLKNIRSLVENNGGKMTIDTSDSFKLIIELGETHEV